MADKINMSLDDIIKTGQKKVKIEKAEAVKRNNNNKGNTNNKGNANNKARTGSKPAAASARNVRKGPPAKKASIALANKVLKRSKAIAARRAAGSQGRVLGAHGRPVTSAGLSAVATKKLVNKLVKNALRKRTNITTAQVARKRGGVAASTLAARRTAAIRRNVAAARGIIQPVQRQRAPQVRTIVQHVQPAPVRVVRQVITAPPADTRIIRGPPQQQIRHIRPQQQQVRQIRPQQQQQRRNVIVQQVQQGRRFRQGNNNRQNQRPTVIRRQVVQQAPRRIPQYEQVVQRVVQVPIPQQRFQQQPRRFQDKPQRFQRQQQGGGNIRYVNAGGRPVQRNTVVRQVQPVQYHPVQYVSNEAVTSRGRGFRAF